MAVPSSSLSPVCSKPSSPVRRRKGDLLGDRHLLLPRPRPPSPRSFFHDVPFFLCFVFFMDQRNAKFSELLHRLPSSPPFVPEHDRLHHPTHRELFTLLALPSARFRPLGPDPREQEFDLHERHGSSFISSSARPLACTPSQCCSTTRARSPRMHLHPEPFPHPRRPFAAAVAAAVLGCVAGNHREPWLQSSSVSVIG